MSLFTQVEGLEGVAHCCSDSVIKILGCVLGLESLFRSVAIREANLYYEL